MVPGRPIVEQSGSNGPRVELLQRRMLMPAITRVIFVCVENSNRSQMAEAFARMHAAGRLEAFSAGSRPSGRINPRAIEAMSELGYDQTTHRSKGLEEFSGS